MATRGTKPAAAARRPAKPAKPERKPKAQEAPGEEKPGMSVEAVVSIVTALLLLAAILTMDFANGKNYGGGWIFKGRYQSAQAK